MATFNAPRAVAGAMVEGPGDVYICADCVDIAYGIVLQAVLRAASPAGRLDDLDAPTLLVQGIDAGLRGSDFEAGVRLPFGTIVDPRAYVGGYFYGSQSIDP